MRKEISASCAGLGYCNHNFHCRYYDYHLYCPRYHLVLGEYFRENFEVELWRANFIKAALFRGKI